ncbi:MAG: sulfatase [Candidatus Altiarchaeota archaeon]
MKACAFILALVLFSGGCVTPREEAVLEPVNVYPKANVILITFDALRPDHLGCYGYQKGTSPNIDSLCLKSLVFTNSFSQSASTITSTPSFLTSKYPQVDNLESTSIAEVLKASGYSTYALVANEYAGRSSTKVNGFDIYDTCKDTTAAEISDKAISILEGHDGGPFFLWVHYMEPHPPFVKNESLFRGFYDKQGEYPISFSFNVTDYGIRVRDLNDSQSGQKALDYYSGVMEEKVETYNYFNYDRRNLTESMVEQLIALYDSNVHYGDAEFGRLVGHLEGKGLLDKSILIVSTDHGQTLGERNKFGHNELDYQSLHTPLILRLPSEEHKVLDYPVMNVDIMPTIMELTGVYVDLNLRGESLLKEKKHDRIQYAGYYEGKTIKKGDYFAVIGKNKAKSSLHNVAKDPRMEEDLIDKEPDVFNKLKEEYERGIGYNKEYDEDVLEKLRNIGYINFIG